MHSPVAVTEDALAHVVGTTVDGVVSVGGGSAVGLGKALAARTGLPHLCLPTTYSGSEMTAILGETRDGRKTTRTDPALLPRTVVYDVELTLALPPRTSAVSGLNALAHCSESTSPVTRPIEGRSCVYLSAYLACVPGSFGRPGPYGMDTWVS